MEAAAEEVEADAAAVEGAGVARLLEPFELPEPALAVSCSTLNPTAFKIDESRRPTNTVKHREVDIQKKQRLLRVYRQNRHTFARVLTRTGLGLGDLQLCISLRYGCHPLPFVQSTDCVCIDFESRDSRGAASSLVARIQ